MHRCRLAVLVALSLLMEVGGLAPRAASAQALLAARGLAADGLTGLLAGAPRQVVAPHPPETFGTTTEIAHVVAAAEFDTSTSTNTWSYSVFIDPTTGGIVRGTTGPVSWAAGLRLPAGAVVTRLEIAGCDGSGTEELRFALFRSKVPPGTGAEFVTPTGTTGVADTPGCGLFSVTPSSPPLVVDNATATYWIIVSTDDVTFDSVRVYYQLQVSPAPAAATFGDVATSHPFFRYVEALVASGITVGCGGGNYCPDAPLTRGQMAVFLAKGLGLHFAP